MEDEYEGKDMKEGYEGRIRRRKGRMNLKLKICRKDTPGHMKICRKDTTERYEGRMYQGVVKDMKDIKKEY